MRYAFHRMDSYTKGNLGYIPLQKIPEINLDRMVAKTGAADSLTTDADTKICKEDMRCLSHDTGLEWATNWLDQ